MNTETLGNHVKYLVHDFWETHGDSRVSHAPLMNSGPWHVLAITAVYFYFVKFAGPRYMKDRKPMDLRQIMLAHNIFLVLVNGLSLIFALWPTRFGLVTWQCNSYNPLGPDSREISYFRLAYIYYLTKFVDLLDTVYFVLRKKQSQITGLHVFHHMMMPISVYMYLKFGNFTCNGFTPLINAFVHTVMYAYYALSALGPHMAKYLWWKRYITQLQLFQFVLIFSHGMYFMLQPSCECPKVLNLFQTLHGLLFIKLFGSFYLRTYRKQQQASLTSNGHAGECKKVQ